MDSSEGKLITRQELAQELGISNETLRKRILQMNSIPPRVLLSVAHQNEIRKFVLFDQK